MQNEKQKAEAYVRSKLPELMELRFGCEVKLTNIPVRLGPYMIVGNNFRAWDASGGYVDIAELDSWIDKKYAEIIGHPIELAHVLRCITEDWRGEFLEVWDLDKDWNDQEERVFNWLCNEWKI